MMMSKRIVLLNTWHKSFDDRVFYHQALSLKNHGFETKIISSKGLCHDTMETISIDSFNDNNLSFTEKVSEIMIRLNGFLPKIIICDSPLAIMAANNYKKGHKVRIIYDITEWYPSKIHLQYTKAIQKPFKFLALVLFNLLAGIRSDGFIFGEYYKSIIFRKLFFWKPSVKLPYYPDSNYIQYYPLKRIMSTFNLLYTGKINKDKGIDAVIASIKLAGMMRKNIEFKLQIIGDFPAEGDQTHFNQLVSALPDNVQVNIVKSLPFLEFCKTIGNTHVFFDLRKIDYENTHCLPIKLFYYLACGRPVIYSRLTALQKEIKEFNFGYLCQPNETQSIAKHVVDYIDNPELYLEHASNALKISKSTYNWKAIEKDFISFMESQIL